MIELREYHAEDLEVVIRLFRETVSRVNTKDYTTRQIEAWLGSDTADVRAKWQASLLAHCTYLAWLDEDLVGFTDMTATGYLDRLFVSADHQGKGQRGCWWP